MSLSNRGFLSITLLILSPVITSFLLGMGLSFRVIELRRAKLHWCEKSSLQVQKQQGQILRRLLKLNPKALLLRKKRKRAEKLYKVALKSRVPKAIAVARLHLEVVKGWQRIHQTRQEALLAESGQNWQRFRIRFSYSQNSTPIRFHSPNRLPVRKQNSKYGSPTFLPGPRFSERNRLTASWQLPFGQLYGSVNFLLKKNQLLISIHCSATLQKRKGLWVPILRPAKL